MKSWPGNPPLRSSRAVILVVAVLATLLAALVAAVAGAGVWCFVFTVLGVLADQIAHRAGHVRALFDRANLGLLTRTILRELAIVILVVTDRPDASILVASCAVGLIAVRGVLLGVERTSARVYLPAAEGLNLYIPANDLRTKVPQLAVRHAVAVTDIALVVGMGLLVLDGRVGAYAWLTSILVGVGAAWVLWRGVATAMFRHRVPKTLPLEQAQAAVDALAPEGIMYFSGSATSVYQLTMWLPTLEAMDRRFLVLVRERAHLRDLQETTLPVLCLPSATDVIDFDFESVRVAFFAAHVGKNIHLLREPRMKHVFVGHGESDKIASVNPATKVFDEVWVAGQASRDRWAAALVGVRDDTIVEVGRPQLGGIEPPQGRDGRPVSVLYAPTWEGWSTDPYVSSLTTMGPELVRWLLARPGVRVIYRPHPFTGTVSAVTRAAHAEVIRLVSESDQFATLPMEADGRPDWSAVEDANLVVTSDQDDLYDCFNHSDLLISDISGVVPDYLASGKPYFVSNPADQPAEELREDMASTRAAYLIGPDQTQWEGMLDDALGPDTMAEARTALRIYTLGPRLPDPVQPWRDAFDSLRDRAVAEWGEEPTRPLDHHEDLDDED